MYTGIIQGVCPVQQVIESEALKKLVVQIPENLHEGLVIGASVAIDGTCLSVEAIDENLVTFSVIQETLSKTTLGKLCVGDLVNVERSMKVGDELGGHQLSGHIDTTAEVVEVETSENGHMVKIKVPAELFKYIFLKGFVAVHGASLTVNEVDLDNSTFRINLIPETLRLTNLGSKQVGDLLNIEIDRQTQVIVDTLERMKLT